MGTDLFKKEPAVIIGFFLALTTAIADAVANSPDASTWAAVLPIIVATAIRFVVVSPATAERQEAAAKASGKRQALADINARRRERYAERKAHEVVASTTSNVARKKK